MYIVHNMKFNTPKIVKNNDCKINIYLAKLLSNNNIKTNNSKPFLINSIVVVVKTVYS